MDKAIFLDRDGTINVEKHYLYRIEDFEFLPGVIEGLKMLQNAGYLLFVVTNQSGIGRGYYTEDDFNVLNSWMLDVLYKKGIRISGTYYCPHLENAIVPKYRLNCNCRKPKLGMYEQAIVDHNLEIDKCFVIGDKFRDCSICLTTSCGGFLIGKNEAHEVIDDVIHNKYENIEYAYSLYEASIKILKKTKPGG